MNRTRLAELPGAERDWIGRAGFELLSAEALQQLAGERQAPNIFGRRLGHLIASLTALDQSDNTADLWRTAYLRYWSEVREVCLGGGLAAALGSELVDAARMETARLGSASVRIELASHPAVIALVGLARSRARAALPSVVLDFGHSLVKRGVAEFGGGELQRIHILPAVKTIAEPGGVLEFAAETLAETLQMARQQGAELDHGLLVSIASYVRDGRPWDARSIYAPLSAESLAREVKRRTDLSVGVELVHDGTAAARGPLARRPAAVIVLGTSLGVGFAPPAERLLPLAQGFNVFE